ncbi:MAG: hypothetical protein M1836_006432 [Candelina mexicana]|nr:MAG: hypothetical protein M1836_006432 [Candelina mexicana]
MEVVLKVGKREDGTYYVLPTSANDYFLTLAEGQGKPIPTTNFDPREYPQIRCLQTGNNSLEIVHEDVMRKYELRQIAPKSRLHPDPQAYCPKEHDGLTLKWSSGPKIFLHGDVLGDGKSRCSNFGAERNKYIRNLAEHFYIKVPEEEFFSIVDFPDIVLPNSKTARPYNIGDASGGGGFDRGFLGDNAPSGHDSETVGSFDFASCSSDVLPFYHGDFDERDSLRFHAYGGNITHRRTQRSRQAYCSSDLLPLYHGDFDERDSLRLQTNGEDIPNPRITPNFADARLPIEGYPDRFSIIETVNMGTGIIAAGGAVVSAAAAVQGMRHLRTQARVTPHSDLEQGISDDGNSETVVTLRGTEALEAEGIASEASQSSLVAPKQPSLLAQVTRTEQTLSNRSHAAWSPSLDTNQLSAISNSNTVPTVTTEAALVSREFECGNESPLITDGHALSDGCRGLPDIPTSDPTSTKEDEPVKALSSRLVAASRGPLLSTAEINDSDQIVLPSVPSTDPVPTIAVKRPHSPSSDKEEAVASRRCHTSLADS